MKRGVLLFLICINFLGFATTKQPRALISGKYIEPLESDGNYAVVQGVISEHMFNTNRSRVEAVDGLAVPVGPRVPNPLRIQAGHHNLALLCEWEQNTGLGYINLNVYLIPNRKYILHCEEKDGPINLGHEFWLVDETDSNKFIIKESNWTPSYRPRGRSF